MVCARVGLGQLDGLCHVVAKLAAAVTQEGINASTPNHWQATEPSRILTSAFKGSSIIVFFCFNSFHVGFAWSRPRYHDLAT